MWVKVEKTKLGAPVIIDMLGTTVIVFVDYPNQNVTLCEDECSNVVEAAEMFQKRKEWVNKLLAA